MITYHIMQLMDCIARASFAHTHIRPARQLGIYTEGLLA
jgi:hypothetical protein